METRDRQDRVLEALNGTRDRAERAEGLVAVLQGRIEALEALIEMHAMVYPECKWGG